MGRTLRTLALLLPAAFVAVTAGCSVRVGSGEPPPGPGAGSEPQQNGTYQGEGAAPDPGGIDPGSDGASRQDIRDLRCTVAEATVTKSMPVPAGDFMMGCNEAVDQECRPNERPPRSVYLDAFEIDETEVTQAQYYRCVKAGKCRPPVCWDPCNKPTHPIGCVNREDAMSYCGWAGKRLPTEAEWEKAARGTDALVFPWGNDALSCDRGNISGCKDKSDTMPVGSFPAGASPYGALDMVGNVVEIVADFYDPAYYANSPPPENPKGPASGVDYVGKGGSAWSVPKYQRSSTRDDYDPRYFKWGLGFRCAK